jgi:putative holliday junction resolvase
VNQEGILIIILFGSFHSMKVLAVDPGDKRIGLALSDPTGTIARPWRILHHQSREADAKQIIEFANEEGVGLIVVGWALDSEGEVGYRARKAQRLADVIREFSDLIVEMWDESGTTQAAIQSRIQIGVSRKKRSGHLDDVAASILLQDFLIHNPNMNAVEEDKGAS